MLEISIQSYIYALNILMIFATSAVIGVIYSLRGSELPVKSVKLFQSYFVVGLAGWSNLATKELGYSQVSDQVSFVFYVLCSFILFLAVVECARYRVKTGILAVIHIFVIGSILFAVDNYNKILIVSVYALVVHTIISLISFKRAFDTKNIGSGIIATAASLISIVAVYQIYVLLIYADQNHAYNAGFIISAVAFTLVGIGFLSTLLINEHKLLSSLALKDPLTGVLNRRGLDYALRSVIGWVEREKRFVCAIAIDIDHFKKVNDTYGHDCGDVVLKAFADTLMTIPRASDVVCRQGGEEFAIVLPDTELSSAVNLAERIREIFQKVDMPCGDISVKITASFGVAMHSSKIDIDSLMKDADKALYQAKALGRNRVYVLPID